MDVCEICGNECADGSLKCPFCGYPVDAAVRKRKRFRHHVVNLEQGRPVAEVAVRRMISNIEQAKSTGVTAITFIHGYGSSGKGGVIKEECQKMLDYLRSNKRITDFIFGEDFHKHSGKCKQLLQRFPKMTADRNLDKNNRGITIVII